MGHLLHHLMLRNFRHQLLLLHFRSLQCLELLQPHLLGAVIPHLSPPGTTSCNSAMTSCAVAPGTQMGSATAAHVMTYGAHHQVTTYEAQQKCILEAGVQTETGSTAAASAASPALCATRVPMSPRVSPKVSPRDDANRTEFRNQVKEAVHQGEEMVTVPTEIAFGILEKGLPESDTSDLKPLKVTRGRRRGGCC